MKALRVFITAMLIFLVLALGIGLPLFFALGTFFGWSGWVGIIAAVPGVFVGSLMSTMYSIGRNYGVE